jgi:hypothetical protein
MMFCKPRHSHPPSLNFVYFDISSHFISDRIMLMKNRKLVGGSITEGASNTSPEEMKRELETYDMKVHRAQTQMVKEMMGALRRMGVPFFGTRVELVKIAGKETPGAPKDGLGMIEEVELVRLQRKMLVMLEDLCSD